MPDFARGLGLASEEAGVFAGVLAALFLSAFSLAGWDCCACSVLALHLPASMLPASKNVNQGWVGVCSDDSEWGNFLGAWTDLTAMEDDYAVTVLLVTSVQARHAYCLKMAESMTGGV